MSQHPTVYLKPARGKAAFARHPWVFAGAIDKVEGDPADAAVVDVRSTAGTFLGRGIFNGRSKIRVRLYGFDPTVELDKAFFAEKVAKAIALRHEVLHLNTGPDAAYRAVFSEADFLSGLVVDRYGPYLTAQFTALATAERRTLLAEVLQEALAPKGIYLRTERGMGTLEGIELQDGLLMGEPPPPEVWVAENNLRFAVNLAEGQKTGYYLDQRDNRAAVMKLAAGRRVLDAFCYTGGFGLYAAKGGATSVECVDASEPALKLAEKNAIENGLGQLTFTQADVFSHLSELVARKEKYDLIVLDPPKFARNRAALPKALQGYRKLHQQAMKLLAKDGVLVSCCCTGLITQEMLEDVIAQVAIESRRDFQILERRGPAADHPVSVACREGGYLKCVISRAG